MTAYWVRFSDGHKPGCVEADSEAQAGITAAAFGAVKDTRCLPHPAEPRLNRESDCPSFCYKPEQCVGRTACPQSYACTE